MIYSKSERGIVIPSLTFTPSKMWIFEDREVSESVESRNRLIAIDLFAVMKHFITPDEGISKSCQSWFGTSPRQCILFPLFKLGCVYLC
jgi:hypothetical protein